MDIVGMSGVGPIRSCCRLVRVVRIITFIIRIMWAILGAFLSFGIRSIILIISMLSIGRILMLRGNIRRCNERLGISNNMFLIHYYPQNSEFNLCFLFFVKVHHIFHVCFF